MEGRQKFTTGSLIKKLLNVEDLEKKETQPKVSREDRFYKQLTKKKDEGVFLGYLNFLKENLSDVKISWKTKENTNSIWYIIHGTLYANLIFKFDTNQGICKISDDYIDDVRNIFKIDSQQKQLFYKSLDLLQSKKELEKESCADNIDEFKKIYIRNNGNPFLDLNDLIEELFYACALNQANGTPFYQDIDEIITDIAKNKNIANRFVVSEFKKRITALLIYDRENLEIFSFSTQQNASHTFPSKIKLNSYFYNEQVSSEVAKLSYFKKITAVMEFFKEKMVEKYLQAPANLFNTCVKLEHDINALKKLRPAQVFEAPVLLPTTSIATTSNNEPPMGELSTDEIMVCLDEPIETNISTFKDNQKNVIREEVLLREEAIQTIQAMESYIKKCEKEYPQAMSKNWQHTQKFSNRKRTWFTPEEIRFCFNFCRNIVPPRKKNKSGKEELLRWFKI